MNHLSNDIMGCIFDKLSIDELARLRTVSKRMNEIVFMKITDVVNKNELPLKDFNFSSLGKMKDFLKVYGKRIRCLNLSLWPELAPMHILELIKLTSALTSLNLHRNLIKSIGAKKLASSACLRNLKSLDLSVNALGQLSVKMLASSEHLKNLSVLILSGNNIKDGGAKALAESEYLKNLTVLKLADCAIRDDGAIALASSENFKTLTILDLSLNGIGDNGVKALAESKHLKSTKLDLEFNNVKIMVVR